MVECVQESCGEPYDIAFVNNMSGAAQNMNKFTWSL